MDQGLREYQAALEREPDDKALRERFLRACVRAEEPVLIDGLELIALLFEGLAAVAHTRPEIAESPAEGPGGAVELLNLWKEGAGGGEVLGLELVRQRLARPGRGPRVKPYGPAKTETRRGADAILELFEGVILDLVPLALARELRPELWVDVTGGVMLAACDAVNACFEGQGYVWSYNLHAIAAPAGVTERGQAEAIPALFPTLHGGGTGWGRCFGPADGDDEPLCPLLRGLFRRAFGPGWRLRGTDQKIPATYYSYQTIEAGERWYGFEIHYD